MATANVANSFLRPQAPALRRMQVEQASGIAPKAQRANGSEARSKQNQPEALRSNRKTSARTRPDRNKRKTWLWRTRASPQARLNLGGSNNLDSKSKKPRVHAARRGARHKDTHRVDPDRKPKARAWRRGARPRGRSKRKAPACPRTQPLRPRGDEILRHQATG